ncbi:hypothetical protein [Bifidobacterium felsineum]|uniref:hypothetical protein n=1 Tax=Bifidobacterium felsineum TaxID=2045440 RepID=UPI0013FE332C|nr:hypothetical protein [Bifidobacterium felsineum]
MLNTNDALLRRMSMGRMVLLMPFVAVCGVMMGKNGAAEGDSVFVTAFRSDMISPLIPTVVFDYIRFAAHRMDGVVIAGAIVVDAGCCGMYL